MFYSTMSSKSISQEGGKVRVLHTVPDADNIDVYADDKLIAQNLAFGKYSDYISLPEGIYKIALFLEGTKTSPVMVKALGVKNDTVSTVAASGPLDDIELFLIPDSNIPIEQNNAMIRFVHFSPNAPAVNITLPDGTVLFENVSFEQGTPYRGVAPGNYTLQVRATDVPSDVVLSVPNVKLDPNKYYTVYAIGLVGGNPRLQALLATDETPA